MADYKGRIGNLIRDARKHRGMTQQQLAERLSTSQSAINRIEKGHQNLSLEMLARIGAALDSEIVALGAGPTHLRVTGPTTLSGSIDVKTSKNAGVALLCASLLNRGRTTLRKVARIEEVNRLLEVLGSLGVQTRWLNSDNDLEIIPPKELELGAMDETAARRTRSVIMFLGPLLHRSEMFELPYAGGCNLGTRTVEPHMTALRPFGLEVKATEGSYHAQVEPKTSPARPIVLTERVRRAAVTSIRDRSRWTGGMISRSLSSLSQRVWTPRLVSTSSSRFTSSMRATLRSVVRPRLSSDAHSRPTPAFFEVLTAMLPDSVVGPVTRRCVGPAPRATISESSADPIRASISRERF